MTIINFLKHTKTNVCKKSILFLHIFWLPLILIVLFIAQNQFFNSWLNIDAYRYPYRLGIVSFSLGLLLYGPAIFLNKKTRYLYLLFIALAVSFVFIAQFLYFKYSTAFLQTSAFKYIGQTSAIFGTIKTLVDIKLLLFIINTIIAVIAFFLGLRNKITTAVLSKKTKFTSLIIILIIITSGYGILINLENKEWSNAGRLYKDLYDLNALVAKVGIVNFTIGDAIKYSLQNNKVTENDLSFIKSWGENRKQKTDSKKYFGIAKNKNIIFLQIESLENSVIDNKIKNQEITPNLNKLVKEGLYFNNFYSEVGPGNTADTEFVVLNSLYALPNNVAFIDYAQNQYNALPKLLTQNGYGTYALHGDVLTFWNRSNIYLNLGYQALFGKDKYNITREVGFGPSSLSDEDFFNQSLTKLEKLSQPFMATMITLSSHTPFELPNDLRTIKIPKQTNLNYTQQRYIESIHYTDQALGKFIEQLKNSNLYHNSIIVIYGDHQSYANINEALAPSNTTLSDLAKNQIPLIILAPNTNLQGEINKPASLLDLYPTVANLLGVLPPKSILGQDILNTETPVVTHRNKIIGTINTILTSNLIYKASADGIYENGSCVETLNNKNLPIENCQTLYNNQAENIKISDLIIRGDLVNLLTSLTQTALQ